MSNDCNSLSELYRIYVSNAFLNNTRKIEANSLHPAAGGSISSITRSRSSSYRDAHSFACTFSNADNVLLLHEFTGQEQAISVSVISLGGIHCQSYDFLYLTAKIQHLVLVCHFLL